MPEWIERSPPKRLRSATNFGCDPRKYVYARPRKVRSAFLTLEPYSIIVTISYQSLHDVYVRVFPVWYFLF